MFHVAYPFIVSFFWYHLLRFFFFGFNLKNKIVRLAFGEVILIKFIYVERDGGVVNEFSFFSFSCKMATSTASNSL